MADRGLNGNASLNYMGVRPSTPPQLVIHPRAPLTSDYLEYCIGDIWINNAGRKLTPPTFPGAGDVYMLTSVARNVATWIPMVGGLMTLTGDLGGYVHGDAVSNIRLTSSVPNLDITGNPPANEVIFSSSGGGAFSEGFITDDAVTVIPNNAGNVFVSGADGVTTTGAGNQITIHAGGVIAGQYTTDAGIATPAAGNLNILGIHGINTSAPGATDIVDVAINNTITLGDLAVVTAGNPSLTLTSGDLTVSATGLNAGGNINMPATNATGTFGVYNLGAHRFMHNSPSSAGQPTNTFLGYDSGNLNLGPLAYQNVGIGAVALGSLTGGNNPGVDSAYNNTAIGSGALAALTTGSANCAVGTSQTFNLTTGNLNTSIGFQGLSNLVTGNSNTAIGFQAGFNLVGAESDNTYIDNIGVAGESNAMRLGTTGAGEILKTYIAAIRGVTTDIADAVPVLIDSAEQLGTISSSIRYKDNVQDMDYESKAIYDLRPVTFEYKKHPGVKQYGLIAEEVEKIMPRLVVYDKDGLPETVKYHELPAILLNEIQRLSARVDDLEKQLANME